MSRVADFLESKSLVSYQLDLTHLHDVLREVVRNQEALATDIQSLGGAVGKAEQTAVDALQQAQAAAQAFGGLAPDQVRHAIQQADEVARHMPQLQRRMEAAERGAAEAGQLADAIQRQALPQLEAQAQEARRAADQAQRDAAAAADEVRQGLAQASRLGVEDLEARLAALERQTVPQLQRNVTELATRTDDNFRQVEGSMRQFDDDVKRSRTDVANLRAELNALENDSAQRLAKVREDVDAKVQMLLDLMQQFERNAQSFERGIIEAGRALSRNSEGRSVAASGIGDGAPYTGSRGVSLGMR